MQQLLFGTVLFAIVFFLFPSFAAYFYLFATLQLLVVALQGLIWLIIVLLISFPYYTLSAMARDPYITQSLQFQLIANSIHPRGSGKRAVHFTDVPEEICSEDDSCYDSGSVPPRARGGAADTTNPPGEGGAVAAGRPANRLLSLARSRLRVRERSGDGTASDDKVIYLSLSATPLTAGALLVPLGLWSSLLRSAQRDLVRMYGGFISGRPALDLQLIQLSTALAEAVLAKGNAAFCADEIFFAPIAGAWVDARRAGAQAMFWEEASRIYAAMSSAEFDSKTYSVQLRLSSRLLQLVLCTHTISQLLCCCGAALLLHSLVLS